MTILIQCVTSFIACIGFSFVFRVHNNFRFALIGSFGGSLGWLIFSLTTNHFNDLLCYLLAMIVVSLYSEIFARVLKAPATIFTIIGCFPLVPGKGIYETMLYCVQGNTDLFINSLINTLGISASLALAILIVSTCFKIYKELSSKKINFKRL